MIKGGNGSKSAGFLLVSSAATPSPVLIYAAERIPGPDGAVERGDAPITEDDAIVRLSQRSTII
jgi:hypothetical protein